MEYHSDLKILDGPDQAYAWVHLNTNFSLLLFFGKPFFWRNIRDHDQVQRV